MITSEYLLADEEECQRIVLEDFPGEPIAEITKIFFEIISEGELVSIATQKKILGENNLILENYLEIIRDAVGMTYSSIVKNYKIPLHLINGYTLVGWATAMLHSSDPLTINMVSIVNDFLYSRLVYTNTAHKNGEEYSQAVIDFHKKMPPPWQNMNAILDELKLREKNSKVFQFQIKDPTLICDIELQRIASGNAVEEIFLWDEKRNININLDSLSSGEKTLLGLATLLYSQQYILNEPILCLDEIDASLHPTMIQSMLDVLLRQSKITRIYFATHSPSTVALAPEESLFFVENEKATKTTRTKALEDLTQGYFTTEGIAAVFRTLKGVDKNTIVISEGKNVDYLDPILKNLGYADQIHVHRWANPGGKGTDNLKPLMALFAEMITSGGRKFVFLFDCDTDSTKFIKSTEHVIGVFLPKMDVKNHPVQRGIENIIPKAILSEKFEDDIYKKKDGEDSIKDDCKDVVASHFISELQKGNIDQKLMRTVFKKLLDLCPPQ